jgi:hypothetical protein
MHPNHGHEILSQSRLSHKIRSVAFQHHERLDGSGYPKRSNQGDMLPESRALAVIDTYEALTNWRPYRISHRSHQGPAHYQTGGPRGQVGRDGISGLGSQPRRFITAPEIPICDFIAAESCKIKGLRYLRGLS